MVSSGFPVCRVVGNDISGRTIEIHLRFINAVFRLRCDRLRDDETAAVFARVAAEAGGIDVLVNSAWGGYE